MTPVQSIIVGHLHVSKHPQEFTCFCRHPLQMRVNTSQQFKLCMQVAQYARVCSSHNGGGYFVSGASCAPVLLRAWLLDAGSLCSHGIGLGPKLPLCIFLQNNPSLKVALRTRTTPRRVHDTFIRQTPRRYLVHMLLLRDAPQCHGYCFYQPPRHILLKSLAFYVPALLVEAPAAEVVMTVHD